MRQINTYSEIVEFKQLYEKLSGLEIPHEFFKYAKTYVFEKNKKIVGGFILSSKRPTVQTLGDLRKCMVTQKHQS